MENEINAKEVCQEYIKLFEENISRDGSKELLEWLKKTDFFNAPASTKYHLNCEGGLCAHSINVFKRLKKIIDTEENMHISDETIAICGLLHDVCKIDYYKTDYRNVKENGEWVKKPYFIVEDSLPYGHGEKSVYIINGFIKLSREEAIAINWHMGWTDARASNGSQTIGMAFNKFPLAVFVHEADVLATYIDENHSI